MKSLAEEIESNLAGNIVRGIIDTHISYNEKIRDRIINSIDKTIVEFLGIKKSFLLSLIKEEIDKTG